MTQPHAPQESTPSPPVSFEEFKLYYESTELVTERRLAMNRWNYSVLVAVLVGVGGVLTWSISRPSFVFVGVCGILILATMAILLCTYWIRQIDDFKALNGAKFQVLSKMAPLVRFDEQVGPFSAQSFCPFDREWEELSRQQALANAPGRKLQNALVLSSSGAEYFIPKAFRFLFLVTALGVLIFAVSSWDVVVHHMSPFDGLATKRK